MSPSEVGTAGLTDPDEAQTLWAHDRRSVGELLREADHLSRELLLDVSGDDAPALLRSWGEAVQGASELWQALPDPGYTTAGRIDADIMIRLQTHAQRMHRSQLRVGWPGDGPSDERLLRIAETHIRASHLIDRYHRHPRHVTAPELRSAVDADTTAARTRIIHALHVGSHAVGLAVRQHLADEMRRTHQSRDPRATRALPRGKEAQRRLQVFERLAGSYAAGRLARAGNGEHQVHASGPDRLAAALLRWDIHAHRVVAYQPTPANLALTAATQAHIATTTAAVVNAGAATGSFDSSTLQRVAPALENTQTAWTELAARWRLLTGPGATRTDLDLLTAAGEVRAASLELTHGQTAPAPSAVIAGRTHLPDVAHSLQQALTAAADLAHDVKDTTRDYRITVPARTALTAYFATSTTNDTAQRQRGGQVQDLASPVDPRALHTNRLVAIPKPVLASIEDSSQAATEAAGHAMSATSVLDRNASDRRSDTGMAPRLERRLSEVHVQGVLPLAEPGWAR